MKAATARIVSAITSLFVDPCSSFLSSALEFYRYNSILKCDGDFAGISPDTLRKTENFIIHILIYKRRFYDESDAI